MWIRTQHISISFKLSQHVSIQTIHSYAPIAPSLPPSENHNGYANTDVKNTIYLSIGLGGWSCSLSGLLNRSFSLPSCLGQWRSHRFSFQQRKSTDPKNVNKDPTSVFVETQKLSAFVSRAVHEGPAQIFTGEPVKLSPAESRISEKSSKRLAENGR